MPGPDQPSYEDLAARNAELLALVAEQAALIEALRAEVAALRRQADRDSSNSSRPPSQDGPAAKAKTGKQAARRAGGGRAQGGQKGYPGASLAWAARPDEILVIEPGPCAGCGAGLSGAEGRVASAVQVFDIPPAALTVTEYQMMRRTCRGCGQGTTAPAPAGVTGGPVCYGPNVTAAATLLASTDVIGVERAADLMGALPHPLLPHHGPQPRPPPPRRRPRRSQRKCLDAAPPSMINQPGTPDWLPAIMVRNATKPSSWSLTRGHAATCGRRMSCSSQDLNTIPT